MAGAPALNQGPGHPLRLKRRDRLPHRTRLLILTAVGLFGALPYAEELWRCARVDRSLRARPPAEVPPTRALDIPAGPVSPAAHNASAVAPAGR